MVEGYVNGYIQRTKSGTFEGRITIDGINLQNISGVYFDEPRNGKRCLWLKRKKILEYDFAEQRYYKREPRPQWEAYLEKRLDGGTVAYKGEFYFLRFKYSIVGVWDSIIGMEKQRLNLFVERLPLSQQTILNKINYNNKDDDRRTDKNELE